LRAQEALDVLGLAPGATAVEVKDAYRDLVKVWHPDRFGTDVRLRQKAEDKLKRINRAYTVLQAGPATCGRDEPLATDAAQAASSTSYAEPAARPSSYATASGAARARAQRNASAAVWVFRSLGILLALLIVFALLRHGTTENLGAASGLQQPSQQPSQQSAPTASGTEQPGADGQAKDAGRSSGSSPAPFQVRSLSEAQTTKVEEACATQRRDSAAYHACVKAQLDLVTNSAAKPNLSGLNESERESIEGACSEAKRAHGTAGYDHCLNAQLAEFAANPLQPDFSGVSEADQTQIEAACRGAKGQGPTAYNRCRVRLVKLLGESK
jgi:DnaJ domain